MTTKRDLVISEFADMVELTCDYVIEEFVIDDKFIPVFPDLVEDTNG